MRVEFTRVNRNSARDNDNWLSPLRYIYIYIYIFFLCFISYTLVSTFLTFPDRDRQHTRHTSAIRRKYVIWSKLLVIAYNNKTGSRLSHRFSNIFNFNGRLVRCFRAVELSKEGKASQRFFNICCGTLLEVLRGECVKNNNFPMDEQRSRICTCDI